MADTLQTIRAFVAVLLPDDVREAIAHAARPLDRFRTDVSFVRKENLHITLKFLGETEPERLERVRERLAGCAVRHSSFRVDVAGLGAFPDARRARVLWAGVGEGAEALGALAGDIEAALAPLGFAAEGRFKAHITIGRVRGRPPEGLAGALAEPVGALGVVEVAEIHLMQSVLSPGGSKYTPLAALPLGRR